jgi:hypothetical protein
MHIPLGCAQVNLKFTGFAAPRGAQMTFGVDTVALTGAVEVAEAALEAVRLSQFIRKLCIGISLTAVHVKMGPNLTGEMIEIPATLKGEVDQRALTPNTAILVRKSTTQGGRMNQGRFYIPGYTESGVDDAGVVLPGDVTLLQLTMDALITHLQTLEIPMVLLHGKSDGLGLPLAVTKLSVQPLVATQRRRLR